MAKKERLKIAVNAGEPARESSAQRSLRIQGSCNGATLRTRSLKSKKLYNRNVKHRKSFALAEDSSFFGTSVISGRWAAIGTGSRREAGTACLTRVNSWVASPSFSPFSRSASQGRTRISGDS